MGGYFYLMTAKSSRGNQLAKNIAFNMSMRAFLKTT